MSEHDEADADGDGDVCPTTGEEDCGMCSGEYCAQHFNDPCDCDVVDRHEPQRDEEGRRVMRSTEKLVRDLRVADAPAHLIHRAEANEFHDYLSRSAMPINDLVRACRAAGLEGIARKAMDGEYDATKVESDEWVRSEDGQAALRDLPPGMRKALEG